MCKIFKKLKEGDQMSEAMKSEDLLDELHIDYAFRGAFRRSEPLSWEEYDTAYHHGGPGAYFSVPSYEEYLLLFKKYKGVTEE
jgi:hypothetical protein